MTHQRRTGLASRVRIATVAFVLAPILLVSGGALAAPPPAPAPPPSAPPGSEELVTNSLIQVPVGCPTPDPAVVVFTGSMLGKDDVTQTVRYSIDHVRAGSAQPWGINGVIDVRYGADYRFLSEGERYLVGAGLDPLFGVLASTVRPAEPTFGGNDVVGVDDLALDCPDLDDPIRTLNVNGTSVDSGVLSLMTEDRRLLLATIMVPLGIVVLVLLGLVLVRSFGGLAFRGVLQLGRAAVTPVADHRATRVRSHRPRHTYDTTEPPSEIS